MLTPIFSLQDNSAPVTVRTRKFCTNPLLSRRQFVVDVLHSSRPPISRAELSKKLAEMYKADEARIVPFGFKTHFGGGRSTGFALIYDSEEAQRKFEPRYRLVRVSASCVPCQSFFIHDYMFSHHRLALCPSWRKLPVNYARSERIVRRRYVYSQSVTVSCDRAYFIVLVPWNQKVQGCGACQEGEVKLLSCMKLLHTHVLPFSSSYQRGSFLRRHECHSYASM